MERKYTEEELRKAVIKVSKEQYLEDGQEVILAFFNEVINNVKRQGEIKNDNSRRNRNRRR